MAGCLEIVILMKTHSSTWTWTSTEGLSIVLSQQRSIESIITKDVFYSAELVDKYKSIILSLT